MKTNSKTDSLPQNIDAEMGLISSCIKDLTGDVINTCMAAKLRSEYFFLPRHQIIFEAITKLFNEKNVADEILLTEKLISMGKLEDAGGASYILELLNKIETTAHAAHWLGIIREKYFTRKLIKACTFAIEEAYSGADDFNFYIEKVESSIHQISQDRISDSAKHIRDSVQETENLIGQMMKNKGRITGVPSGFYDLDKITYGFQNQEMIVIAARPGMGKTSIALNIAEAALFGSKGSKGVPTLFFSLEMSHLQLTLRLMCARGRVEGQLLKEGQLPSGKNKDLIDAGNELKKANLFIDDSSDMNILEMRAKARRMQAQHGIKLIIVDYLQLVQGSDPRAPREQQVAEISRNMKGMAKELNVPVIVLAQLNRDTEKENRDPRPSDLRESGSIEQDADMILLIHYARKMEKENMDEEATAHIVPRKLIIAKNRSGPVGSVLLSFNRSLTKFENPQFANHHQE